MLRLRGKGLPRFGGGMRGDLHVRIQVRVPERLSERQRQLLEQLRAGAGRTARSQGASFAAATRAA
jgi:DnaJ-class molecular chaperone